MKKRVTYIVVAILLAVAVFFAVSNFTGLSITGKFTELGNGICECSSCGDCEAAMNNANCQEIRLTKDIDTDKSCLVYLPSFVGKTLDCQGHKIKGKGVGHGGRYYQAILLNQKNNNVIKNCEISGFDYGIRLRIADGNLISNSELSKNKNGLEIYRGENNVVSNVRACDNTGYDVYVVDNKNDFSEMTCKWSNVNVCNYDCEAKSICTDSDSGLNIYEKGAVYYDGKEYVDSCKDKELKEYYCNVNGKGSDEEVQCDYGCENGACLIEPTQIIITSPEPKGVIREYSTISWTKGDYKKFWVQIADKKDGDYESLNWFAFNKNSVKISSGTFNVLKAKYRGDTLWMRIRGKNGEVSYSEPVPFKLEK